MTGQRVEIPAYADMWMRGARFGVVEAVRVRKEDGAVIYRVRLDHPQASHRLFGYLAEDCREIS